MTFSRWTCFAALRVLRAASPCHVTLPVLPLSPGLGGPRLHFCVFQTNMNRPDEGFGLLFFFGGGHDVSSNVTH